MINPAGGSSLSGLSTSSAACSIMASVMFSTSGDGTRTTMSPWRWISNDSVDEGAAERLMEFGLGTNGGLPISQQGNRPAARNQAKHGGVPSHKRLVLQPR